MKQVAEEMRLDQLAAAAGVPTTTIRLYRQRGLLHEPRLVGRTGWYDQSHLSRLRLIARLQDDGFSLAGIAKLLESWESGRDLREVVGVEEQLDLLLHPRAAKEIELATLADRLPDGSLTPDLFKRALALGLVEAASDGRLIVPDPRFLETGVELAHMGIPLDALLDEWEHLTQHTDDLANRFTQLFETHLLDLDADSPSEQADLPQLGNTLERLRHTAAQVLLAALDASLARVAAERLAELLPADAQSESGH